MYSISFTAPNLTEVQKIAEVIRGLKEEASPAAAPTRRMKKEEATPVAPPVSAPDTRELFEKVKDITTQLVKISRETAVATLRQFNASTATGLKPEQYTDFIKAAQAVLDARKTSDDLI